MPGGSTWVISDPHFGHANILKFERSPGVPLRDFPDVETMDETIIQNWNDAVADGDRVYLLGDVAFHPRIFDTVIPRLKGRICLVPGNHEPEKSRRYFHLFDDVRGYVVKKGFIMSHIPIHPGSLSRWQLNIHGHTHANYVEDEDNWHQVRQGEGWVRGPDPRYYCACVEQQDYRPRLLDDILKERGIV